jgi:putative tricarboxylic transport membrane protein
MEGPGEKHMRRRRFLACGLGAIACAAGCGTERAGNVVRTGFSINAGGHRWARVGQAFAAAARAGRQPRDRRQPGDRRRPGG